MPFDPANSLWCGYALEAGAITEGNGTTPAAFTADPSDTFTLIGYMESAPTATTALNNSWGHALGSDTGMIRRRGPVLPSISYGIQIGSTEFLQQCFRDVDTRQLNWLTLYIGLSGKWTRVYRFCKGNTVQLSFASDAGGGSGQLSASATFEAMATYKAADPYALTSGDIAALSAIGSLFFHDVRAVSIGGSATFTLPDTTTLAYRIALMNAQMSLNNNLERKPCRPNWGDNSVLSRTSYHLLEHNIDVNGAITWHEDLDTALFTGSKQAMNWGALQFNVSDAPGRSSGSKILTATLSDVMPTEETLNGVPVGGQVEYSTPFTARDMVIATS